MDMNEAAGVVRPAKSTPPERVQATSGRTTALAGAPMRLRIPRSGGLVLSVLLVAAVFAVQSSGRFLDVNNLLGLSRYMSTVAIIGLGLTIVMAGGEVDISFGSLYGFVVITFAVAWLEWVWPLWLCFVAAYAVALLVGSFNALIVVVFKVSSIIATLGSSVLIVGFTLLVSGNNRYTPLFVPPGKPAPDKGELDFFLGLANHELPAKIPMQVVWMAIVAVLFFALLHGSVFGLRLRAIGGNVLTARLAGLAVNRYKWVAFMILGAATTTAGLLDFSYITTIAPDSGPALLFPTITAVIIGGTALQGGQGSVIGTLLGALLLAVLANGLAVVGAGAFMQQMLLGAVTIGAVVLDQRARLVRER
jgi:ribose/xylose/arabinose/galactoside ABC-type transport system permease subunit